MSPQVHFGLQNLLRWRIFVFCCSKKHRILRAYAFCLRRELNRWIWSFKTPECPSKSLVRLLEGFLPRRPDTRLIHSIALAYFVPLIGVPRKTTPTVDWSTRRLVPSNWLARSRAFETLSTKKLWFEESENTHCRHNKSSKTRSYEYDRTRDGTILWTLESESFIL